MEILNQEIRELAALALSGDVAAVRRFLANSSVGKVVKGEQVITRSWFVSDVWENLQETPPLPFTPTIARKVLEEVSGLDATEEEFNQIEEAAWRHIEEAANKPKNGSVEFSWQRRGGYECSSKGDKRFSAFYAKMPDGRSIEDHYQCDVKGYPNWRAGKGKPSLKGQTREEMWEQYLALWVVWAENHPEEMADLHQKALAHQGVLSDCFANTEINQAHALSHILNLKFGAGKQEENRPEQEENRPEDVDLERLAEAWQQHHAEGQPFIIGFEVSSDLGGFASDFARQEAEKRADKIRQQMLEADILYPKTTGDFRKAVALKRGEVNIRFDLVIYDCNMQIIDSFKLGGI